MVPKHSDLGLASNPRGPGTPPSKRPLRTRPPARVPSKVQNDSNGDGQPSPCALHGKQLLKDGEAWQGNGRILPLCFLVTGTLTTLGSRKKHRHISGCQTGPYS